MVLEKKSIWEQLFKKTDGLEFCQAIFTTYTLSTGILPDVLLEIIALERGISLKNIGVEEKLLLLARYGNKAVKKITIFADDELKPALNTQKSLQKTIDSFYLPEMVCRIAPKKAGVFFHPKIIMLYFTDAKGNDFIRIAILSKNLTHGMSMIEIGCLLENVSSDRGLESKGRICRMEANTGKRFAEFFDLLTSETLKSHLKTEGEMPGKTLSRNEAARRIEAVKKALETMQFQLLLPEGAKYPERAEILFGYPNSNLLTCFEKDVKGAENFYWCSDSIGESLEPSRSFIKKYRCKYMISNPRSWYNALRNEEGIVLSENIPDYAFYLGMLQVSNDSYAIHAKFFEGDIGEKHVVWLGSTNFSENAFTRNFECDIRMEFTKEQVSETFFLNEQNSLVPMPFCRKLKSENERQDFTIKKVSRDALEVVKTEQDFISRIQGMEWVCKIEKESLFFETKRTAVFNENESKWLQGIEVFLPTSRRQLEIHKNAVGEVAFKVNCSPYTEQMIPWYGFINVVFYKSFNSPVAIPIKVTVEKGIDIDLDQPIMMEEEVSQALLGGRMFSLRTVIPPEPCKGGDLYHPSDSFDIRLAKYVGKGGTVEAICKNIDLLLVKMSLNEQEDDAEDEEMPMDADVLEKLKQRLVELKKFLSLCTEGEEK